MTEAPWAALRAQLPILSERRYLATHAIGPLPIAARAYLEEYAASLSHRLRSVPLHLERMETVRGLLAQLIGAPPRDVALMPSASAAEASVALSLQPGVGYREGRAEPRRRRILISRQAFPSSRFLWEAQAARGFEVHPIEAPGGERDAEALVAAIDERVTAVALPWVEPRASALIELAPLVSACRAAGALLIVDGFQALGVVPLDVGEVSADVVLGGVHKWLCGASMGLAMLYVAPEVAAALQPAAPGWVGSVSFPDFGEHYQPAPGAARFQQGTPPVEPLFGAQAGLELILSAGVPALRARSLELTERLLHEAAERGLRCLTPRARGGTVALDVGALDARAQGALVQALAAIGVDVDTRRGALRISPYPAMAEGAVSSALADIAAALHRRP
ncbi:MAG: aminotransferase class V-fold PLP-dependent enzyme [Polyangiaceae bacterium]|nr:aminotransferase class V-fold PLP-dependent enzyme [Polyangiaceae bacterium]MCW5791593.1 aminotransferase class V-fold PLP-dependent enzyme [Polyangiaceae bacterium]